MRPNCESQQSPTKKVAIETNCQQVRKQSWRLISIYADCRTGGLDEINVEHHKLVISPDFEIMFFFQGSMRVSTSTISPKAILQRKKNKLRLFARRVFRFILIMARILFSVIFCRTESSRLLFSDLINIQRNRALKNANPTTIELEFHYEERN